MPFWSGETIIARATAAGSKIIDPFIEENIDCASYALSMGKEVYVTPEPETKRRHGKKQTLKEDQDFLIPAGQFAFLLTKEYLEIPKDVVAFISLKSRFKYAGLVNVSGFHVDPGFRGNLIFAVYNAGPKDIVLTEGVQLFLIWFSNLDNHVTKFNRIDLDKKPQTEIPKHIIHNVRGPPITLKSLETDVKELKNFVTISKTVLSVLGVLAALFLGSLAVDWGAVSSGYSSLYHWANRFIYHG